MNTSRSRETSGTPTRDIRRTDERVLVRLATPDEYPRAGEVVVAAYDAEGYLRRPDGSYDNNYANLLADVPSRAADSEVLVAVVDDEIVGTFTWCGRGSSLRELAVRDDQGELRMLGVLPHARGLGVASTMVRWCIERAEQEQLSEIVLSSLPDMAPAHRLYEANGFVRRRELDWSPLPDVALIAFSRPFTR